MGYVVFKEPDKDKNMLKYKNIVYQHYVVEKFFEFYNDIPPNIKNLMEIYITENSIYENKPEFVIIKMNNIYEKNNIFTDNFIKKNGFKNYDDYLDVYKNFSIYLKECFYDYCGNYEWGLENQKNDNFRLKYQCYTIDKEEIELSKGVIFNWKDVEYDYKSITLYIVNEQYIKTKTCNIIIFL
jgi:hypothetical protein